MTLIVSVFFIQIISMFITAAIIYISEHYRLVKIVNSFPFLLLLIISSTCIGTFLSIFAVRFTTKPFRRLADATKEISSGNFDVRVDLKGPLELEMLSDHFNRMAVALGSIDTLRNDFVRNVSHEFKTPVVSISGFARLLKKSTLTEEKRNEYINIIIQESERLSQLSGNVLLLSKLEQSDIFLQKEKFLLDEQIRYAVLILEPEWKRKNLTILIDLLSCPYDGYQEIFMQLWINLIGNAIKFTEPDGEIQIQLLSTDHEITVMIKDNGIGMNSQTLQRIFDRFYQGDSSHSVKGNGLGLALVKRILELSEGFIQVDSEENKGTRVTVTLQRAQAYSHVRNTK